MNCCVCGKEVNVDVNPVPPTHFDRRNGDKLETTICSDCYAQPEHKKAWNEQT